MADPLISIKKTLLHEGGYVNDPNDSGGETNYGISKRQYPALDIKNLTEEAAVEIYRDGYWKHLYSQIKEQAIADKLFDMGVLFGVGTAIEVLQIILQVPVDRIFGQGTLAIVNISDPITLLDQYKTGLVSHAVAVVSHNPKDKVFFAGWVKRINS
jgi:lysozyme family protein